MTLTEDRIATLVEPYLLPDVPIPSTLYAQLSIYLDLLLRWNARTNLTAIRDPEEIVRRHFGESLFAGAHLLPEALREANLLDFGSGAGFPGLPIQLLLPNLRVTLSESQGKKAAFLQEAIRTLGLPTEVWAQRVEAMPPDRKFEIVALRAVDNMGSALDEATRRLSEDGVLAALGGNALMPESPLIRVVPIPANRESFLYLTRRISSQDAG